MIERWSRDQVLALAPDAASQKTATGVSSPAKWSAHGVTSEVLWGECKGSGSKPYRACVDLSEPAYRCSCPSRKFPCKHALGLLLLWSADGVPAADEPADWAAEWMEQRRDRAEKQASRLVAAQEKAAQEKAAQPATPDGAPPQTAGTPDRRAAQREQRVTAGLSELERWLADQIAQGLADARRTGPAEWDALAKRMVDAQVPGMAGTFTRLSVVLRDEDWPGRLLGEYALVHLLAVAHRRAAGLPHALGETVRSRIGFPVAREDVLASPAVRDRWDVIGSRDEEQDRLVARRVWLRGRETGRAALVLSFAPVGQALDASLVNGTTVDAELAFYPGAAPLRALAVRRHGAVHAGPPPGPSAAETPGLLAGVLAEDPWIDSWPVVLSGVVPANDGGWLLADPGLRDPGSDDEGGAEVSGMRLDPAAGTPWRLLAVSGGHPVTVACEWTPRGLWPLTTWDEEGQVVLL
ncbi:SWIM zinc finger family protein [Microtetraspora malaysiensis]|uniref:SWIM zinc finger family protein n=1 Tax=Microtetraspora malaysiensis TaxID=161358 RepID=UPI003D8E23A6